MSFHIEITAEQARAVAALAEEHGAPVALRQLVPGEEAAGDVYATVPGDLHPYRISRDGAVHELARDSERQDTSSSRSLGR